MPLLAAYKERFDDAPPSILTEEGAAMLMARALRRGSLIMSGDLAPPTDVKGGIGDRRAERDAQRQGAEVLPALYLANRCA